MLKDKKKSKETGDKGKLIGISAVSAREEIKPVEVQSTVAQVTDSVPFSEATTRLSNDTLTYTIKGNTKPISLIMKNMDAMKLPPLIKANACIRYQDVTYLNETLKNSKDKAPADFVEGVGTSESEDDLEVNIL